MEALMVYCLKETMQIGQFNGLKLKNIFDSKINDILFDSSVRLAIKPFFIIQ